MKRGVSPLIAWVLIIGLTITLSLVVGSFIKKTAEDTSSTLIDYVEGGATCDKIIINAKPLECNKASEKIKLEISNEGFLSVDQAQVRIFYIDNTVGNEIGSFNNALKPNDVVDVEVRVERKIINKLQVIPIREEKGCVNKKIELSQETQWFVGGC